MSQTTALFEEGADLIVRSLQAGIDALSDMRAHPDVRSFSDRMANLGRSSSCGCTTVKAPGASACGCEIPPPCWYPKAAGEVTSFGCPGSSAMLRVRVHNCGPTSRRVQLEAEGATFDPPVLALGPMQRAVATIKVDVPDGVGATRELLLWIRGCHAHYVRWSVVATNRGGDCCHELEVEDCPDYLHHWYDHFYCAHPCQARGAADAPK